MNLGEMVTRLAARTNKNSSDTAVKARLINQINDAAQEKWDEHDWSFRNRTYQLPLTADVTSGTMTATNGSQTVTASGTPFVSAAHTGGWIRFNADAIPSWYQIRSVDSTSSVTLETPYQGTTGGSKAYVLKRTEYKLASEIWDLSSVAVSFNERPLTVSIDGGLTVPRNDSGGSPDEVVLQETDVLGSTYSTGTVTGTINTDTLTGVGTAWLTNVTEGDRITIGSYTYTIYRVVSDTSIRLYNALRLAASASTYTISTKFRRILKVEPSADQAYVLTVRGRRKYAPLVNDLDQNEFTERYWSPLLESSVWREQSSSPDNREDATYLKSEAMWLNALAADRSGTKRSNPAPIWTGRSSRSRRRIY